VLANIVDHALDADPARRWTVPQIRARLQAPVANEVEEETHKRRFPIWVFAALAALVLIVAGLSVMRRKEPVPVAVQTTAPVREPAIVTTPKPRPVVPVPARATPPVSQGHAHRAAGWAVIVAAYGTEAPAEKRKRSVESKWPGFQWSVLQQKAEKSYYLVVIGRNLSEDDAEALRKRALQAGLPRDVYIKRM
jgi:hypothetical protein